MELTELERAWKGLDERLAGLERHARGEREHRVAEGVRVRLRGVAFWQLVQLAIGIAIVLVAGPYWIGHWGSAHLVVYGIAIHLYGLALLIVAATQLMQLWRVDYRRPVLDVQKRLLELSWFRVRSERWLLVAGFVAWVPAVFAIAAAAGLDVWLTNRLNVWLNLVASLAMAAVV